MDALTPIRATLERPESAGPLRRLLASEEFPSRSAARRVCKEFGFRDPLGRPRVASCAAALSALAGLGRIGFPPGPARGRRGRPRVEFQFVSALGR